MEIRAATVVAVEAIKGACDLMGRGITSVEVDWYLWERGEGLELKGEMRPHHRTRTIFY